jgi:ABC-type enterobactin transport system permease subunit
MMKSQKMIVMVGLGVDVMFCTGRELLMTREELAARATARVWQQS